MRYVTAVILTFLGLAGSLGVSAKDAAQPLTGEKLLAVCNSQHQSDKALCRYYIIGVTSGIKLGLYMASETPAHQRPCLPRVATGSTLEAIVVPSMARDFAAHPSLAKDDAAFAIAANLSDVFPCSHKD